jgi:tryptophan synthase beta chain
MWRPTPLIRALRLEEALETPAHIYFKYEGVSPSGSHKPNTSVAQAYYNKIEGTKALTTETGAGQWGSALAMAGSMFDLPVEVYMVKISYQQKPYRRSLMKIFGAEVYASPTDRTNAGRAILEKDPDSPGSLGVAISEAVEVAATSGGAKKYALGSVLNHVMLHQTIIGQEVQKQMQMAGEDPDVLIGCIGGGSNFAGFVSPFVREKIVDGKDTKIIAVEPAAAPSLTKGKYVYDFGDTGEMTPLMKMYTLGHSFIPAPIHAGGLRYHGMAPIVSQLILDGIVRPRAVEQKKTFEAGITFARCEGSISAPECNHAIAVVIEEALKAKAEGKEKVILFNWSGHGLVDLPAYASFLQGELEDHPLDRERINRALKDLAGLPRPRSPQPSKKELS